MKKFLSLLNMFFILISIEFLFLIKCEPYPEDTDICSSTKCSSDGLACSDITPDSCDPKCKPKYGDNTKCYYCPDNYPYYYINEEGTCVGECSGSSVIFRDNIDSKECTNQNFINDLYGKCLLYFMSIIFIFSC